MTTNVTCSSMDLLLELKKLVQPGRVAQVNALIKQARLPLPSLPASRCQLLLRPSRAAYHPYTLSSRIPCRRRAVSSALSSSRR